MKFQRFKVPIGIGAMHREYEILMHLNGTPNKEDTQSKLDPDMVVSYAVAVDDLIACGLVEKNDDNELELTIPGREVLRLCHE